MHQIINRKRYELSNESKYDENMLNTPISYKNVSKEYIIFSTSNNIKCHKGTVLHETLHFLVFYFIQCSQFLAMY